MSTQRYQIPEDLLLQEVQDETVILDPATGNYYTLDAVGSYMLKHYRHTADLEDTVAKVVKVYDVAPATVRRDLQRLLREMAARGLVELTDP